MANPAAGCELCPLAESRQHVVWGEGSGSSGILIQGEAPGREEDQTGRPFVGRSGYLLNRLLSRAGLDRGDVYITNTVRCRPPDNRKPLPREEEACQDWLELETVTAQPRVILAMGRTAARRYFPNEKRLPAGTARSLTHFGLPVTVIATYHPSHALRDYGWDDELDVVQEGKIARMILRDLRRAKEYASG